MSAGATEVGRKKKVEAEKQAGPLKPRTIGIRATGEWAAWLEQGAKHCRTDVAKLLDSAVAEYLERRGFKAPPPERIP